LGSAAALEAEGPLLGYDGGMTREEIRLTELTDCGG
jgi:hypothetical protein